ncbi:glycosyltransferase family 61 protein [Hydrogenophaga atypica]|uniref:Glycosyltransferase family 61 protein n=1 Tax=Hydrogenophaga atypica TaxID=249409 RepID=A0ABW2QEP0_9BURK
MQQLSVIPPDQLYSFAKQAGLLAIPSEPPPCIESHQIPAADVLDHTGATHTLPSFKLSTTTSFQLKIPQALVWGTNLGIIFDGHMLPGGFSHQHVWAEDGRGGNNLSGSLQLPNGPFIDTPFPSAQMMGFSSHWGHFFTDCLDRMLASNRAGQLHIPMVTDSKGPCDPAMHILSATGHIDQPIEVWPLQKHAFYRFKELRLHSLTSQKPAAPVGSLLALRAQLSKQPQKRQPTNKVLFVGREDVTVRKVLGQAALQEALHRRKLADVVHPERIGPDQSMSLFRNCTKILMPIGSAKFNLTFCEPGTQIVCIAPRNYAEGNGGVGQMLRHMCASLDLRLRFYACRSTPSQGPRSHMLLHNDLLIDSADIDPMLSLFED